jgi:hypothetical protein
VADISHRAGFATLNRDGGKERMSMFETLVLLLRNTCIQEDSHASLKNDDIAQVGFAESVRFSSESDIQPFQRLLNQRGSHDSGVIASGQVDENTHNYYHDDSRVTGFSGVTESNPAHECFGLHSPWSGLA